MPFSLAKWSLVHATICIVAVGAVFFQQGMMPLFIAGILSFSLFIGMGRPLWPAHNYFGVANQITLARLILTLSLFFIGLTPDRGPLVFAIALLILIVDGLDGWMARRKNEASEFGEYFDKETDAFFLLTLCFLAFFQQKAGAWIVIPGLLRYLFVVVLVLLKPEIDKEYRSKWARAIYVTMIIALLAVFITPYWFYSPLLAAGTTGIFLSFAHYFRWLFSLSSKKLASKKLASKEEPGSSTQLVLRATLSLLILNSLLLIPSFIANFDTSTFFPIPDPSQPLANLTWTRGWYDYFLYFFLRRPNQDLFRICADVIFLITVLVVWSRHSENKVRANKTRANKVRANRLKESNRIPKIFTGIFVALIIYEAYDAMAFLFFHRHGILYEDAQYILNLYYLAIDAFSIQHLFQLILVLTGVVLFIWWIPALFQSILRGFSVVRFKKVALIFSCLFWPVFMTAWMWYGPGDERPVVRSIAGKIKVNASESIALSKTIAAIEEMPVDRIYDEFETTEMAKKPNIYLFMIESYGRVLRDNAYLKPAYDSLMINYEKQFSENGWLSMTRYSEAPVSGGLSWLSMNSVLSGLFMKNRTFYTRYISRINQYPHLIRFLKQQGYYTLTLQPPNKARLGLPLENHYNYDKTVFFDDLHYEGIPYSIWVVPDQYSLGYTHEHYLPRDPASPYFLFFETATTHAPWTNLPPYVADWKTLNTIKEVQAKEQESGSLMKLVKTSFNNRFNKDTPQAPDLYYQSIEYDLKLIKDYILHQAPANSLFIIIGDHQPPLIPSTNYDTPIHVITQDASLMTQFSSYEFRPGMFANEKASTSFTHAGIYSMLIDVVTHDAGLAASLPSSRYRPNGVAPSVLTTSD